MPNIDIQDVPMSDCIPALDPGCSEDVYYINEDGQTVASPITDPTVPVTDDITYISGATLDDIYNLLTVFINRFEFFLLLCLMFMFIYVYTLFRRRNT